MCPGDQMTSEARGNMGMIDRAVVRNMIWHGSGKFWSISQVKDLTKQVGKIIGPGAEDGWIWDSQSDLVFLKLEL